MYDRRFRSDDPAALGYQEHQAVGPELIWPVRHGRGRHRRVRGGGLADHSRLRGLRPQAHRHQRLPHAEEEEVLRERPLLAGVEQEQGA